MENNICIYALIDPRTDEIRYVGQTVDPAHRIESHISSGRGSKAKNKWLGNLYRARQVPRMLVLDWVPAEAADEYERRWIKTLIEDGVTLTNSTFNPNGVRYVPAQAGRGAKQTGRVYQYLDQILQTENRVASFAEVRSTLDIPKSTASKLRLQWLDERGLSEAVGENGHGED